MSTAERSREERPSVSVVASTASLPGKAGVVKTAVTHGMLAGGGGGQPPPVPPATARPVATAAAVATSKPAAMSKSEPSAAAMVVGMGAKKQINTPLTVISPHIPTGAGAAAMASLPKVGAMSKASTLPLAGGDFTGARIGTKVIRPVVQKGVIPTLHNQIEAAYQSSNNGSAPQVARTVAPTKPVYEDSVTRPVSLASIPGKVTVKRDVLPVRNNSSGPRFESRGRAVVAAPAGRLPTNFAPPGKTMTIKQGIVAPIGSHVNVQNTTSIAASVPVAKVNPLTTYSHTLPGGATNSSSSAVEKSGTPTVIGHMSSSGLIRKSSPFGPLGRPSVGVMSDRGSMPQPATMPSLRDLQTSQAAPQPPFSRPSPVTTGVNSTYHGAPSFLQQVTRPVMPMDPANRAVRFPHASLQDNRVPNNTGTSSTVAPILQSPLSSQMSPRPSILRKNTPTLTGTAKRTLQMFSGAPASVVSDNDGAKALSMSPKAGVILADPSRENSQSSTDTVLSSESDRLQLTPVKRRWASGSGAEPQSTTEGQEVSQSAASVSGAVSGSEHTPRKKRRKQTLTSKPLSGEPKSGTGVDGLTFMSNNKPQIKDEPIESPEMSRVHTNSVAHNLPLPPSGLDDGEAEDSNAQDLDEYVDSHGVCWTKEPQRVEVQKLFNWYCFDSSYKPRYNHFEKHSDFKCKEERRPTVNELSNARGAKKRSSGWKLHMVASQTVELACMETDREKRLSDIMSRVVNVRAGLDPQDPLHYVRELSKGNLQRSKLLREQYEEVKNAVLKVREHSVRAGPIIARHHSKRPVKKKERS